MVRARVTVQLKQDVMDPQGNAVQQALASLGHGTVRQVRVGRSFDILLDAPNNDETKADVKKMCESLLANTVIERYEIELTTVEDCKK